MKAGIGTRWKKRRKGGAASNPRSERHPVAAGVTLTLVVVTLAPDALANPLDGRVVAGQATISSSGTRLEVRQTTDRAIVDWRSFSIAPGEHTHFQQPSATSTTLNRVTGPDPSAIAGRMSANGRVILVNPNGIAFSRGAQVDVNSLVATTSDIADRDFMDGRLRFDRPSTKPGAAVSNEGEITVQDAGLAALVAPAAANSGTINARLGKVVLGGAEAFVLDLHGDGLISFQIVEPSTSDAGKAGGRRSATNNGTIRADGGVVEITAADARGVVDGVVNTTGVISARTVQRVGGKVLIGGGSTGSVTVDGQVDVSGAAPGQTGGSVAVSGREVRLGSTAVLDASGRAGGGRVEVGGSFQGRGPQPNARRTRVDRGAKITADALGTGNGGTAIVWADDSTWFAGAVSARGGMTGGNGGFIEVSGKQRLVFRGTADTLAPAGRVGTTLLDPVDIVIASSTTNDDGLLSGTGALYGDTVPGGTATFTPATLAGLTGDVVLQAARDITVTDPITFGAGATSASLQAGRNLSVNATVQTTGGASLDLLAGRDFDTAYGGSAGALMTTAAIGGGGTGAVTFAAGTGGITLNAGVTTAGGKVTLSNAVTLGGGTVTIDTTNGGATAAGGDVSFSSTLDGNGNSLRIGAGSGGAVTISGAATNLAGLALVGGGTVDIQSTLSINAGGSLNLSGKTGGSVTVRGALTTPTLTTSGSGYSVALLGGGTVDNAVAFTNIGAVTLGDEASDQTTFTGGLSTMGNTSNPSSTSLAGTIRSTNQPITIGTATLEADTTIDTGSGSVTLNGINGGNHALTVTADTLTLAGGAGSITGSGALVLQPGNDSTSIGLGGAAGTFNLSAAELATLGNGFASITIGRATGAHAITVNAVTFQDPATIRAPQGGGSVIVNGSITGTDDASITLTGASGITLNAGVTTAGGKVTLSNAVTLGGGTVTIDTTNGGATAAGGDVSFSSTLDGNGNSLRIGAGSGGAVTISGAATNLAGLALVGGGTVDIQSTLSINAGGSLNLSGKTGGSVTVRGALTTPTLTTSGSGYSVALLGGGTVDNAVAFTNIGAVTLGDEASDQTTFTGGVTATAPSPKTLAGRIQTTNAAIDFGTSQTKLTADTVLSSGSGNVTLAAVEAAADGGAGLTVTSSGITRFDGAVGGSNRLSALTSNGGGTTALSGGSVTTTGNQTYGNAVTLGADMTLSGVDVTFSGAVNSASGMARTLVVSGSGATSFQGAVGGAVALSALTSNGGGTTALSGGSVTTTGNQTYGNAVTLGADMTLSGVDVTFSGAVNSASGMARTLVVSGSGATSFQGAVGGAVALSALTSNGGGTTALSGGSVTTTGNQTYGNAVTLGADMTLSGVDVTFSGTVNSASGTARTLVVSGSGATSFQGAVGGVVALSALTSNGGGTTALSGGSVTTTGNQTYGNAVTLGADMTLSGVDVTFSGTVNSASGTARTLVVSGSGATSFQGAVGGAVALSTLTSNGGGTTALSGGSVTTTGNQTYGNAVTLGADMTLSGMDVTFSSTVNSASGMARTLVVSGSGATSFQGAVGGVVALSALTSNGGGTTALSGGSVTTSANQTYGNAVTLGADMTLSGVDVTFSGTVNSASGTARTLVVSGSGATSFQGAVGGVVALSALTSNGGGTTALSGGSVTTTGNQTYGNAVTLGADMTLSGVDVTFSGTVNSANGTARTLVVSGSGATSFQGAVGGAVALSALTSNGGGTTALSGGSVTTTGNQTYGNAVTLGADMTLSGMDVTFSGTVNSASGTARTLVVSGSGATSFQGAVGGAVALSALTSNGGGTTALSGGSVTTTGNQTYGNAVTLKSSSTLTSSTGGRIAFGGTVDPEVEGAAGMSLITGGDVVFDGAVGGSYRLGALTVTGAYNLTAGSSIRAASLTHSGGGGTSRFAASLDTNASPGISIANGTISIDGPVSTGNNTLFVSASGTGALTLGVNYDAGTASARFISGGAITQTGGILTAGTLTGSAGGATSLTRANSVATLGGFTSGAGFAFTNASSLAVSGSVAAGGDLALVVSGTDGTLTLNGILSAAGHAIGLAAGGSISQATGDASAALTARALLVKAGTGGVGSAALTNTSNAIASAVAGSAVGSFDLANNGSIALGSLSAVGAVDGATGLTVTGTGGTIRLQSETGDVTQATGASLSTTNLLVHAGRSSGSGSVILTDTGNRVSGAVAGSAGQFTLTSGSSFTVANDSGVMGMGTIAAQAGIAAQGWDGAIRLHTLTGDITQQERAPLNATLVDLRAGLAGAGSVALSWAANSFNQISGSATGSFAVSTGTALRIVDDGLTAGTTLQLRAQGGDLTQAAGADVVAPKLLAQASGGIALTNSGNRIGTVAGTAGASILLYSAGDLTVGGVTSMTTAAEIKGLTAAGELAVVRVGRQGAGSLTLDQPVLATDKTFLQARGDVTVSGTGRFTSRTVVIDTTNDASLGPESFTAGDASPSFLTLAKRRPVVNGDIALAETSAGSSEIRLFSGSGAITGTVYAKGLGIAGVGGSSSLFGAVGGRNGTAAAQFVFKQLPRENAYKFNNCAIGGVTCVVLPPFEPVRPEPTLAGPVFHQVFPPADPIRDSLISTGNEDFIRRWTK